MNGIQVPAVSEIDIRVGLRNEIIALKRVNESMQIRLDNAETFARQCNSEVGELREQLKGAKQLIATQKSAIMAWQENDNK